MVKASMSLYGYNQSALVSVARRSAYSTSTGGQWRSGSAFTYFEICRQGQAANASRGWEDKSVSISS
jgi:septal ring factor EnvC (AmiA/AmiB activator)